LPAGAAVVVVDRGAPGVARAALRRPVGKPRLADLPLVELLLPQVDLPLAALLLPQVVAEAAVVVVVVVGVAVASLSFFIA